MMVNKWLEEEQQSMQYELRRYGTAPVTWRGCLQVAIIAIISSFFLALSGVAEPDYCHAERYYDPYGRKYWSCEVCGYDNQPWDRYCQGPGCGWPEGYTQDDVDREQQNNYGW